MSVLLPFGEQTGIIFFFAYWIISKNKARVTYGVSVRDREPGEKLQENQSRLTFLPEN